MGVGCFSRTVIAAALRAVAGMRLSKLKVMSTLKLSLSAALPGTSSLIKAEWGDPTRVSLWQLSHQAGFGKHW